MFSLFLASWALSLFVIFSSALASQLNLISSSLNKPAVTEKRATNIISPQDSVTTYYPDCSAYYGRRLNRKSCDNAKLKIPQSSQAMSFGQRGTGPWDVILPRRYLSDNGLCAIDVRVNETGTFLHDVSDYNQITGAANAVMRTCVNVRQSYSGGIVKHLGMIHRTLSLIVSDYSPQVQCHDERPSVPPVYNSCKEIIDYMYYSETLTKFGLVWQPGVQVPLPYFLISTDRQCKLVLAAEGPESIHRVPPVETASWGGIWTSAVAINEMCVRRGRSGSSRPISVYGTLLLFFFGRGTDPPQWMLSSLNISASDLNMLPVVNATSLLSLNSTASSVTES